MTHTIHLSKLAEIDLQHIYTHIAEELQSPMWLVYFMAARTGLIF